MRSPGFYYGFANEGLWPLCHNAHVRPTFRTSDWEQYVAVNKRFAQAVVEEAKTDDPVVLVQDYHFALLPKMVREKLPNATIIMFWHIPWPNAESYGICPWRQEILEGLLGSSIVGFHTRSMATISRTASIVSLRRASTVMPPLSPMVAAHGGQSLSDLHRMAVALAGTSTTGTRMSDAYPRAPCDGAGSVSGDRGRSAGLHEGHHRAVSRGGTIVRIAA